MNQAQRKQAMRAAGEQPVAAGVIVAMTALTIDGKNYKRGETIGGVDLMENWLPANKRALLSNGAIEIRPA